MIKVKLNQIAKTLAVTYTAFTSIFALDVFAEDYSWLEIAVALFMHLLPTFALIAATILAWKKPLPGGIVFVLLGVLFTVFFHTYEHIIGFSLISAPILIIGTLFILSAQKK